jgi:hypothetical protein
LSSNTSKERREGKGGRERGRKEGRKEERKKGRKEEEKKDQNFKIVANFTSMGAGVTTNNKLLCTNR